jgi:16S rRNA (cytosine1402-N4)-methyltransferase
MRVGQLSRNKFDFILADLGYNNEQLERVDGLSYTRSGLLDMRYSQKQPRTAASLLSSMSVLDLATVLRDYSDIRDPQKIAERVLGARPSTAEALVEVLSRGGEPQWNLVAKVFQALRMVVNSELTNLKNLVEGCKQWLGPDGLSMVIGFSSL